MLKEHQEDVPSSGAQGCPKCGHTEIEIEVEVVTKIWVQFGPSGEHEVTDVKNGDPFWEDDDAARCWRCTWTGRVRDLAER